MKDVIVVELSTADRRIAKIAQESADSAKEDAASAAESAQNAASYDAGVLQTEVYDSTGDGVISGLGVTVSGMTATVAAGKIHMPSGKPFIHTDAATFTIPAADSTKPRIDLIYESVNGVRTYLEGDLGTAAVAGSNTYTMGTNVVAGSTVAFDGVTFTATASTQDTTNFVVGSDIATSMINLATALNANTTVSATYTAVAASGVITVTEKTAGGGNTPGTMTVTGTGAITAGTATTSTAASATAPALPGDGLVLANITVSAGATNIADITDLRKIKVVPTNLKITNPLDYGAMGDGLGLTPNDTGVDITNASWNQYPLGSAYYNSSYTPDATITTSTKPFSNTDSWDAIGIQRAVWNSHVTFIPKGTYLLTKSIQKVRGMEGIVQGAGAYQTVITYKDYATFVTRPQAEKALVDFYRVAGGPPTYLRDLCLKSTDGVVQGIGLNQHNCNQNHILNCWITGFDKGICQTNICNDGFISNIVTEYCNSAIHATNCDTVNAYHCDFWQSAGGGLIYNAIVTVAGADCNGDVDVHNCKFVGFNGAGVMAAGAAKISGCDVVGHLGQIPFDVGANSQVTNNRMAGGWGYGGIKVGARSTVLGNHLTPASTNDHSDIRIAGSNCTVIGNNIIHSNIESVSDNYAIYVESGTNNHITENYLTGGSRANISAGSTDIVQNNFQNGVFTDTAVINWTPSDGSTDALTLTQNVQATYLKTGKLITASFDVIYPTNTGAQGTIISGLPFPALSASFGCAINYTTYSATGLTLSVQNSSIVLFTTAGAQVLNSAMSGKRISGSVTYIMQ